MAKDSTKPTILVEETEVMERQRRLIEQERHNKFAKVNAREHRLDESQPQNANELDMNNGIPQHPFLATQRFDGTDPNLNPEPPLNSQARADYDNAKREQEMEKQLRLGLVPDFKNTPTPKPT
jgi:hypothetical protein